MKPLFCHPDAWSGGYFELALELGPRSDERVRAALSVVWAHPTLAGCFEISDSEPEDQERIAPGDIAIEQNAYGVADIPGVGRTCCLSIVFRESDGSDWLTLGVPMGSLAHVAPTGAYPFEDDTDLSWRSAMYAWLRQIAETVSVHVPFQLGLIEHEVSGDTCADDVRREGIPSKRWFGYLWPENGQLEWFGPTEGAPHSIDGK